MILPSKLVVMLILSPCLLRNLLVLTKCGAGVEENGVPPYSIFCDTQIADGGWTVIQRRKDNSVAFNRPWSDHEKGFGDLNGS